MSLLLYLRAEECGYNEDFSFEISECPALLQPKDRENGLDGGGSFVKYDLPDF